MFVTVDLYEGKNMKAVVRSLHSLGRVAQQRGFTGPTLVAATKNARQHVQNRHPGFLAAAELATYGSKRPHACIERLFETRPG